jgi:LacI family transcriptional regulator
MVSNAQIEVLPMATIKEIALLAGVSRGTVDRVLNNRGAVNPETERKVRQIADAINYTPNRAGKSLAVRKKNYRIAFVLPEYISINPFFNDLVAGAQRKAKDLNEYGVTVEFHYSRFADPFAQAELLDRLAADGISGVAIAPVNHPSVAQKIRQLMEGGVPVVTSNTDIENSSRLAYVGSNYYESGRTAAGMMGLITAGRANIGVVSGSASILGHTERIRGFSDHIAAHAPGMHIISTVENNDDDIESYTVTKAMLEAHPEIDAVYITAAGVYGAGRAIQALERSPAVRVVCFDTVPTTVQLIKEGVIAATIDQQPFVQGSKPLSILYEYLTLGTLPREKLLYTSLNIRIRENL